MKIESIQGTTPEQPAEVEWKKLVAIIRAAGLAVQALSQEERDELDFQRRQSEQEAASIISFDNSDRSRY